MAFNLSNEARAACQSLVNDASWLVVVESIKDQTRKAMHEVLGVDPDKIHRAAGYAQALHDIYVALDSGMRNVTNNKTEKLNPLDTKGTKNVRE